MNLNLSTAIIIGLAVTIGQNLILSEQSWAAQISCTLPYTTPCVGTNGPDSMTGNRLDNGIFGLGGNDVINASSGNDFVNGMLSNDSIAGHSGNDFYWEELVLTGY